MTTVFDINASCGIENKKKSNVKSKIKPKGKAKKSNNSRSTTDRSITNDSDSESDSEPESDFGKKIKEDLKDILEEPIDLKNKNNILCGKCFLSIKK